MYKIVDKKQIAPVVYQYWVHAPSIAKNFKPGQFVILRIDQKAERIPLTIAGTDSSKENIRIIFQKVGSTTADLSKLNQGDLILDVLGPLGNPSHIENFGTVLFVAGGVGIAEVYPQIEAFNKSGNRTIAILGARSKEYVILMDEIKNYCEKLIVTTDDGSLGEKGFVTDKLTEVLKSGDIPNRIITVGPLVMMRKVVEVAKQYGIKTIVSLNTIMVDGTGMCASCRCSVDKKVKFACVDGPDFEGDKVDFDELIRRSQRFIKEEKDAGR